MAKHEAKSKPNQTKPNQHHSMTTIFGSRNTEIQLLLGVVGAIQKNDMNYFIIYLFLEVK
jgi:hypothetical protein